MKNQPLPEVGSHFIKPETALEMIRLYRKNKENILAPEFKEKNLLCFSETFNGLDVESLITQAGCRGLRIYYGMKDDLQVHAILVGVDANGNGLFYRNANVMELIPLDLIMEDGQRCPPACNDDDLLNS